MRARARWHEHGEKSNKYFLSLEKRNHIRKHIRKLNLSGVITCDPYKILESGKNFYKDLYTSKHPNLDSDESKLFFENGNIPKLSEELYRVCEGKVSIEEITEVFVKITKSPESMAFLPNSIKSSGISSAMA